MALLKFICNDCKHIYEELTRANEKPPCPNCGSENTRRHYCGKCYSGGSTGSGNACSGGSCSTCSGCGAH